jgi:hypothetical protein
LATGNRSGKVSSRIVGMHFQDHRTDTLNGTGVMVAGKMGPTQVARLIFCTRTRPNCSAD